MSTSQPFVESQANAPTQAGSPRADAQHPAARIVQATRDYYKLDLDRPDRLLHRVERADPKFRLTLLSAYDHAHPGALAASRLNELHEARARIQAYAAVRDSLVSLVPGLRPVKGLAISACYPAPLLRHQGDLDLHAPDEAGLWRAAQALIADGWQLTDLGVRQVERAPAHLLTFCLPHGDDLARPIYVELTDVAWLGDGRRSTPRRSLPASPSDGAVTSLLFLSLEAFERPLGLRDAVDSWLLAARLTEHDRALLVGLVGRLRLHDAYRRLLATVERGGLLAESGLPDVPSPSRRRPALCRPDAAALRWLQWAGFYRGPSRLRDAAWERLAMRVDAPRALRFGLWTFGVPAEALGVHDQPQADGTAAAVPQDKAVLRGRRRLATPVGDFFLVAGPQVPADILVDATG
ncbi:nucleotidyltransferase family protein [Streptacidiphilus neutrinimicus]|uniref:nucleotidyltransferase family protein n=1 Tax=Streptacidiphilus neutrinimicus TaxID=105420 RepID=UPI0005A82E35|nr:nucleotidyltransferase family protein [Streptacidiphilus neutrinimicus]